MSVDRAENTQLPDVHRLLAYELNRPRRRRSAYEKELHSIALGLLGRLNKVRDALMDEQHA